MSDAVFALAIDEHLLSDGGRRVTRVAASSESSFRLTVDGELDVELSLDVLDRVMERYGKPLAPEIALAGPRLELPGGRALVGLRHRARYDVVARDFLVLIRPGAAEALAELSTSVAAALEHLARSTKGGGSREG